MGSNQECAKLVGKHREAMVVPLTVQWDSYESSEWDWKAVARLAPSYCIRMKVGKKEI